MILLPQGSFVFIFGVNHFGAKQGRGWFVMKALIYSFLYIGLKVGEKGDIWGVTELLGATREAEKSSTSHKNQWY